ncbi:conserved oligomeric Golgi complex subunit 8 isoform X1 [Procambarus clarkii]|uniref:conserved oligomeric Golgi complex subunit 8 isoform X1 n=2 Tax=Procambarus clarkii TaxID=6728 RepID=UPI001E673055|nr:conserved oligomeric Golgi complex subunit 8-like [Procambarus clarkii]
MDVEVEDVAKLLFPEGILDSWKDSEEFSNYIIQLASCGVEKLAKEGAHLREERSAILDQTRDLAYSNYKTFIHTADCSRAIYKDFTRVESHLEGLSSCLPNLRGRVEAFLATSRTLAHSRHLTSLTLTKHTQLLEILELPQLMDTCVRNGYYEEALEILAYVRRLEKKHTDIPIIAGIVREVQSGTRLMLSQLLAQLRSPLALPQCLKVIGLLRRLDVFTEPELRLKFLQARDSWFNGILKGIPKEDAYQHIIKVVEASRVHLFDIVTQYRAIFSDDDTRFSLGDPEVNEQAIFHGWILHKVNQFIKIVEKDLQRGVGTNLEAVLAQCMFFGQSFSRIGADFRNLLIPLFQKAALLQCEKDIRTANIKFDETLSSFSLMEAPQLSASTTFMAETQDKTRPPLTLMEFPPLAHYMNGLVTTFNTLRQCCPVATLPDVNRLLQQSLTKIIAALTELHRLESSGFTSREEKAFQRMCSVVAQGLLPHVNNCLRLLYPLQHISLITGVPVTQLQRENFGLLKLEQLLAPIEHLLPKKEENYPAEADLLQDQDTINETTTKESQACPVNAIEDKISEMPQSSDLDHECNHMEESLVVTKQHDFSPQHNNSHAATHEPLDNDAIPDIEDAQQGKQLSSDKPVATPEVQVSNTPVDSSPLLDLGELTDGIPKLDASQPLNLKLQLEPAPLVETVAPLDPVRTVKPLDKVPLVDTESPLGKVSSEKTVSLTDSETVGVPLPLDSGQSVNATPILDPAPSLDPISPVELALSVDQNPPS